MGRRTKTEEMVDVLLNLQKRLKRSGVKKLEKLGNCLEIIQDLETGKYIMKLEQKGNRMRISMERNGRNTLPIRAFLTVYCWQIVKKAGTVKNNTDFLNKLAADANDMMHLYALGQKEG